MKLPRLPLVLAAVLALFVSASAADATRVTVGNFKRAETDNYFANFFKDAGVGKFAPQRDLAPIDNQAVIRMNRDTLYSTGLFDLDAGPVTITLPDAGKRFMAVQVINEDHYTTEVIYKAGEHRLTREKIGTRYVLALVRTFVDPNDPADLAKVHALQDAIKVSQKSPGAFEVPNWDQESLTKLRQALNALAAANGGLDSAHMFGRKDEVDPVEHLIGTAAGWGGNPREAALYLGGVAKNNDGKAAYRLTLKDVPVDGFWSVSIYNEDGFFEKNDRNAYSLNNVTGKPNADGSYTIQFGGDPKGAANYLPVPKGWNYLVRLYRPRKEILEDKWKLPELVPVQ